MSYLDNVKNKREESAEASHKQASLNAFTSLSSEIRTLLSSLEKTGAKTLDKDFVKAVEALKTVANSLQSIRVTSDEDIKTGLRTLTKAVAAIDTRPVVKVASPTVEVNEREIDFKPLINELKKLEKKAPEVSIDISGLTGSINEVKKAINDLAFPVANFVLPFKNTEGAASQVQLDSEGRLPVTNASALVATTGTIAAVAQTVSADVSEASNVMLYVTGTFSAVNCTFEGSIDGGTSWFAVGAARTNANTVELTTGSLSAAPAYAWELSVNAMTNIRVRCTARSSGTQNWTINPSVHATEPVPITQTHAVTGSGNFAVTMAANATTTPSKARDAVAGASDTGIPSWNVRRDTPTAVTPAAGDWEVAQIDSMGSLWVRMQSNTTSAVSSVAGSASSVTLLALNAQRKGATIHNDSSAVLYVKLGATASTSSYTVKMAADSYYEVPFDYTGVIDGIWASATGNARVTEITR